MGVFFKKTESKNAIDYELMLPKFLAYAAFILGVISILAVVAVGKLYPESGTLLKVLILLIFFLSWGLVGLIQLEFLFIRLTLIRKLNKEGGKILFPDTGSGSAAAAMTLGKSSPLIFICDISRGLGYRGLRYCRDRGLGGKKKFA